LLYYLSVFFPMAGIIIVSSVFSAKIILKVGKYDKKQISLYINRVTMWVVAWNVDLSVFLIILFMLTFSSSTAESFAYLSYHLGFRLCEFFCALFYLIFLTRKKETVSYPNDSE